MLSDILRGNTGGGAAGGRDVGRSGAGGLEANEGAYAGGAEAGVGSGSRASLCVGTKTGGRASEASDTGPR